MYITGLKVLWISEKNGNGICIDNSGNECYIDSSINGFEQLKRNDQVDGEVYTLMPDKLLCVRSILTRYNSVEVWR